MSWSITVNNLPEYEDFPLDIMERMLTQHVAYPMDMRIALQAAKRAGLMSATLAGARTPNPYGPNEVVTITITGHSVARDFFTEMTKLVTQAEQAKDDG
jgi:hypothetical protein